MPGYGSTPLPRGVLPAFACAAGKYFLQQSSWPYNTNNKEVTYNLFHHHGDAFSTIYSEVPQNLTVAHNPILYAGVTSFDVTANDGAFIALTVNDEIIGTAVATGIPVTITIPGQVPPDHVLVTITRQNYYRYQSLVAVIPPTGPYIVQSAIAINDAAGNNNGIMETGEDILASISVTNVGVVTANNVYVAINTSDEFITITDQNESYGNIAAGAIATITDGFAWEVAEDIPDMHNVTIEVVATDGTNTWITSFNIQGHAPLLEAGSLFVDDLQGNNNGRLDPGETANIRIQTYNNGSFVANASMASLNTSSGWLTLNNATYSLGNIGAGAMIEAVFNVTASATTPVGTAVILNYGVVSGAYIIQQSYATSVGLIVEDWETGDMSQFNWVTGGNSNWALSTTNPYEGMYCIKSGVLGNSQNNYLSLQYETFNADSISFWYKVSSESGYDFLKFYVDNVEKSSWSGEVGWLRAAYAIAAGTHTFKWTYSKDVSVASGSDCAWVDFIVLPAAVFDASFNASATSICEGESINFYDQTLGNPTSWNWTFEGGTPAVSSLQNPVVLYSGPGVFDVTLSVNNGIETSTLFLPNYITVSTLPAVAPVPTGITSVCAEWGSTSYSTTGLTGITTYDWMIEPAAAGNVSGTGMNVTVIWTNGFLGVATLKVAGENICGAGAYSPPLTITRYLPEVTLESFDWVCLNWPEFELTGGLPEGGTYTGTGVSNGMFNPEVAGAGAHTITYTYEDPNGCENFTTETILVDPCTGIDEQSNNSGIMIFPNPNNGLFTLKLNITSDKFVNLSIYNSLNEIVLVENNIELVKNYSRKIDLSNLSNGIYYIHIYGDLTDQVKKIIIQK